MSAHEDDTTVATAGIRPCKAPDPQKAPVTGEVSLEAAYAPGTVPEDQWETNPREQNAARNTGIFNIETKVLPWQ